MEDSRFNLSILPPELITDILVRLPVKSLLQFRSVSKSWLSFISSPQFVKTHLSLSANNKDQAHHRLLMGFSRYSFSLKDCSFGSLFCNSVTEAYDMYYPMELGEETYSCVGSVNGLICVVCGKRDLFIWNPSIRKYKKLTDPIPKRRYDEYKYGFGYDELHDDYKVVSVFIIFGRSPFVDVKIYSLKRDSWRKIPYCMDGLEFIDSGKFVNGKLHWRTATHPYETGGWKITFIDLAHDYCGNVEKPPCRELGPLGVLGNDLCSFDDVVDTGVDVWVMKEYGLKKSWTKMFSIEYSLDILPESMYNPSVFLSNNGEILVGSYSTFMIFNAKDEQPFRFVQVINSDHDWPEGIIYIESLVSPLSVERTGDGPTRKAKRRQNVERTKDGTRRKAERRQKKFISGQSSNKKFE